MVAACLESLCFAFLRGGWDDWDDWDGGGDWLVMHPFDE
tara:strand:+ start:257 stop:373 length:117 start_codon:yes stop_codon:yes gene_type:complete